MDRLDGRNQLFICYAGLHCCGCRGHEGARKARKEGRGGGLGNGDK